MRGLSTLSAGASGLTHPSAASVSGTGTSGRAGGEYAVARSGARAAGATAGVTTRGSMDSPTAARRAGGDNSGNASRCRTTCDGVVAGEGTDGTNIGTNEAARRARGAHSVTPGRANVEGATSLPSGVSSMPPALGKTMGRVITGGAVGTADAGACAHAAAAAAAATSMPMHPSDVPTAAVSSSWSRRRCRGGGFASSASASVAASSDCRAAADDGRPSSRSRIRLVRKTRGMVGRALIAPKPPPRRCAHTSNVNAKATQQLLT